ncbi:MAG: hypothetical protein LBE21_04575 [Pseudomonadales bacterium]|jgi:hypothetical protein|nr:hypothetical protein [Pseudomonadales bacterium]
MSGKYIKQKARSARLEVMHFWRGVRIPSRIVENVYGSGNFDDAGDELIATLRRVSGYPPDQYRYRFDFDSTHQNPWYHTFIFEIQDIPDAIYEQFISQIAILGLLENQST